MKGESHRPFVSTPLLSKPGVAIRPPRCRNRARISKMSRVRVRTNASRTVRRPPHVPLRIGQPVGAPVRPPRPASANARPSRRFVFPFRLRAAYMGATFAVEGGVVENIGMKVDVVAY